MLGDFCFLEFMAHRKQVSSVLADPDKLKAAQQAVEAMRRQMLSPRSLAVIKLARRMTAAEAPETEVPEASIAEAPAAPMAEVAQATEVPIYAWHSPDRNPAIGLGFQGGFGVSGCNKKYIKKTGKSSFLYRSRRAC